MAEAWREGLAGGGGELLYHVRKPGLGFGSFDEPFVSCIFLFGEPPSGRAREDWENFVFITRF
jgi:hypothetical protein